MLSDRVRTVCDIKKIESEYKKGKDYGNRKKMGCTLDGIRDDGETTEVLTCT